MQNFNKRKLDIKTEAEKNSDLYKDEAVASPLMNTEKSIKSFNYNNYINQQFINKSMLQKPKQITPQPEAVRPLNVINEESIVGGTESISKSG